MLILPKSAIDPLKKYRTTHRADIDENDFSGGGWTVVQILPELIGSKVDIMTISLCKSLGATCVRITQGECTCDAIYNRATIFINNDDTVRKIEMEVCFAASKQHGPMCGSDLNAHIYRKLRDPVKKKC